VTSHIFKKMPSVTKDTSLLTNKDKGLPPLKSKKPLSLLRDRKNDESEGRGQMTEVRREQPFVLFAPFCVYQFPFEFYESFEANKKAAEIHLFLKQVSAAYQPTRKKRDVIAYLVAASASALAAFALASAFFLSASN
jgi:hypothetical protein